MRNPLLIIARRGRAEVLRALGRFDEALIAYDALLAEDSKDQIARNGRSSVLMALHRYDEALENLPDGNLTTLQDWIGYQIRGTLLLSMKDIDGALRLFQKGENESPWLHQREYFRLARTVALSRRDLKQASQFLEQPVSKRLLTQVNILRLHSFGELGASELANNAYNNLVAEPVNLPDELVKELHRRYILRLKPTHDDDWLFDQELSLLLLAA